MTRAAHWLWMGHWSESLALESHAPEASQTCSHAFLTITTGSGLLFVQTKCSKSDLNKFYSKFHILNSNQIVRIEKCSPLNCSLPLAFAFCMCRALLPKSGWVSDRSDSSYSRLVFPPYGARIVGDVDAKAGEAPYLIPDPSQTLLWHGEAIRLSWLDTQPPWGAGVWLWKSTSACGAPYSSSSRRLGDNPRGADGFFLHEMKKALATYKRTRHSAVQSWQYSAIYLLKGRSTAPWKHSA